MRLRVEGDGGGARQTYAMIANVLCVSTFVVCILTVGRRAAAAVAAAAAAMADESAAAAAAAAATATAAAAAVMTRLE